jgi:hypothetical protein
LTAAVGPVTPSRKKGILTAFKRSMKNADNNGSTMNAAGEAVEPIWAAGG